MQELVGLADKLQRADWTILDWNKMNDYLVASSSSATARQALSFIKGGKGPAGVKPVEVPVAPSEDEYDTDIESGK